jgi:hypothetical protein
LGRQDLGPWIAFEKADATANSRREKVQVFLYEGAVGLDLPDNAIVDVPRFSLRAEFLLYLETVRHRPTGRSDESYIWRLIRRWRKGTPFNRNRKAFLEHVNPLLQPVSVMHSGPVRGRPLVHIGQDEH